MQKEDGQYAVTTLWEQTSMMIQRTNDIRVSKTVLSTNARFAVIIRTGIVPIQQVCCSIHRFQESQKRCTVCFTFEPSAAQGWSAKLTYELRPPGTSCGNVLCLLMYVAAVRWLCVVHVLNAFTEHLGQKEWAWRHIQLVSLLHSWCNHLQDCMKECRVIPWTELFTKRDCKH